MKVLVTGAINFYNELQENFSNTCDFTFIQNELEEIKIDVSEFEYVICNALFKYNDIKKFRNLKYIQVTSSGLDRLPLEYINENGITVFNARGVYSIPMAEWVLCKILDVYKQSFEFYENQKMRVWEKRRDILELTDKIVTIVGYGSVGFEIAKRLKAFGVKIQAVDIVNCEDEFIETFYHINDLIKAVHNSDITILTLPLNDKTRNIFNQSIFSEMKKDSILINISRGSIIKENDLIAELRNGRFLKVILDVFEEEPLTSESELWNFENVIITPHNSFVSNKNNQRLFNIVIKNLNKVIE